MIKASLSSAALVALWSTTAAATTLEVGPAATYPTIAAAMAVATPGDVVEVQGDQTYPGPISFAASGTSTQPITVRGIPVNGHRPVLTGIGTGPYDNMVVLLGANHFVLESFEIVGDDTATDYCIVNVADDVTLRDLVVHDCLHQAGLVGNDSQSGSLTLEYSEFYHNGNGEESHQIYMATDEVAYPHSVFRMQFCYVHDAAGGNSVQSRAERNEIYYNWIEGAQYHELDLIGPDVGDPNMAREDSDVVGNVLVKSSEWRIARIGGDGSGNSGGRYRFVNNTMVLAATSPVVISLQQTVDTLEMYNNVVYGSKAGFKMYDINDPIGPDAVLIGSNNWVPTGTANIPTTWTATATGGDPGWIDPATHDLRPAPGSPLIGQGTTQTATMGALAFPSPLALPAFSPPERRLIPVGTGEMRNIAGAPAIGAFEPTAAVPGPPPPGVGGGPPSLRDGSTGDGVDPMSGSCKCRSSPAPSSSAGWLATASTACLALARRRRRRR